MAKKSDVQLKLDRIRWAGDGTVPVFHLSPLGGPHPRVLPDGRVIRDPDDLKEVADWPDEDVVAWLDIPEIK